MSRAILDRLGDELHNPSHLRIHLLVLIVGCHPGRDKVPDIGHQANEHGGDDGQTDQLAAQQSEPVLVKNEGLWLNLVLQDEPAEASAQHLLECLRIAGLEDADSHGWVAPDLLSDCKADPGLDFEIFLIKDFF